MVKTWIGCALCVLAFSPFLVRGQIADSTYERIDSYFTDITVHADASIDVTETIHYNAGQLEHHGIYRDIILRSAQGGKVYISNISVDDDRGLSQPFTQSWTSNGIYLKIGDSKKTFSGPKTYIIHYTLKRTISYLSSFDELYWNTVGDTWQFPIVHASAKVTLPDGATVLQAACYYGPRGSTLQCPHSEIGKPAIQFDLASDVNLGPGQGMTIAVGFPKNVVSAPSAFDSVFYFLMTYWAVVVPVGTFIVMFRLWYKKGRDPKGRGTIVPEYDVPQGVTPLEMSLVLNQHTKNKDISAEIIYLATKGYIKITHFEKKMLFFNHTDYELTLLKPFKPQLGDADTKLLSALFTSPEIGTKINLSDLEKKFYVYIPGITKAVAESVVAKNYYGADPRKVIAKYTGLPVGVALILLLGLGLMGLLTGIVIACVIISVFIAIIFGRLMPAATESGALLREQIEGLKMYIAVAEKDRIAFHNAPEKKPELFEKLLPYAMLLGLEDAWAKQFEGIFTTPPNWYNDTTGHAFSAVAFSHNLSAFSAAATSSLGSTPGGGSGGGGSSGGGGGGGGGGSW